MPKLELELPRDLPLRFSSSLPSPPPHTIVRPHTRYVSYVSKYAADAEVLLSVTLVSANLAALKPSLSASFAGFAAKLSPCICVLVCAPRLLSKLKPLILCAYITAGTRFAAQGCTKPVCCELRNLIRSTEEYLTILRHITNTSILGNIEFNIR